MSRIPASKVRVTRTWLVDCDVCEEAVEPQSGGFCDSRRAADEAKRRHLEEHARGDYAAYSQNRKGETDG